MFAINHAATALVFKRRFPEVALVPLLFAVQAMEFAWVVLNYAGIERTTTAPVVRGVGDIQLAYMPFSHSVLTVLAAVLVTWGTGGLAGRARLGAILGLAILSHLVTVILVQIVVTMWAVRWGRASHPSGQWLFQTSAAELADLVRASFLVHPRHTMSGRCT